MRIDRLRVKNFKGFDDDTFEFPRSMDMSPGGNGSFHLIIGQNGTGKTSILDALAVAAGSWFLGVRGNDSRHIQTADVRVKVIHYRDTARIEQQLPVLVEADGIVLGETIHWERELRARRTTTVGAKTIKTLAEHAIQLMQQGETTTLPVISYFGTGRLWLEPKDTHPAVDNDRQQPESRSPQDFAVDDAANDLSTEFDSRLAGYRYSIDPRSSPRNLLRWLKFEQQLAVQDGRESTQFQVVKKAIEQSVEGCKHIEYHLRLGLLLDIEGQPRLPFRALSDGQRNMIAMIGDLAFKAAQLNPHLGNDVLSQTPGVVLIDELDLHLHPRWQRHVVEDLRRLFPEIQFICTTHSPFIVQTLRTGELIPLDAQPIPETDNLGVEEIARGLMGVESLNASPRYHEMVSAAKDYLTILDEAAKAPDSEVAEFERKLVELIAPYPDNPAFQAFLELKHEAKLGRRNQSEDYGRDSSTAET